MEYEDVLSRLLAEAFRNLRRLCAGGGLLTLRLELAIPSTITEACSLAEIGSWPINNCSWARGPAPKYVWDKAVRAFTVAMEALERSLLPVQEHLDIFGGAGGYALACDVFLDRFDRGVPWPRVFGSLKKMSLGLSAPYTNREAIEGRPYHGEQAIDLIYVDNYATEQNGHSQYVLSYILRLSNEWAQLGSLDMLWYDTGYRRLTVDDAAYEAGSPAHIAFKECTLRGLYMKESDVMRFLDCARPEHLTLADISLFCGTWAPIFVRLASPEDPTTTYHLGDLLQGTRLVQFDDVNGRAEEDPEARRAGGEGGSEGLEPGSVVDRLEEVGVISSGETSRSLSHRLLASTNGLEGDPKAWREKKMLIYGYYDGPRSI